MFNCINHARGRLLTAFVFLGFVAQGAAAFADGYFGSQDLWSGFYGTNYNPVTGQYMPVPAIQDPNQGAMPVSYATTSYLEPAAIQGMVGCCDQSCVEPCPACPCGFAPQACWAAQAEAIWLDRSTPNSFGISFPGSNDPSILNTKDLNFGLAPGYQLTLTRFGCDCTSWEVSYFGVQSWSETREVISPTQSLDPFLRVGIPNIANFRNAFLHRISGGTDLHSLEVNKRWTTEPFRPIVASLLAGFRYINVSDNFEFFSLNNDPAISEEIGRYTARTHNDLVGAQVGGSVLWRWTDAIGLGARLKAGLFSNFADQKSRLINVDVPNPPTTDLTSQRARTQLAGLIETGIFGTWFVASNFGITAGYNVYLLSGLALATEQLDFTANTFHTQPFVNTDGTLVFHGPTVGFWYTW